MMTALLTAAFTLGVLAGLALAVFLSTAAERRWFSCLWGRLRVSTRRALKVPAPMSLEEAWAGQERVWVQQHANLMDDGTWQI
jgi:hypothetical protein